MPRLFIAIDLPERIRDDITGTYEAIPGARWTADARLHVTLRFIGEVSHDMFEQVRNALNKISSAPFTLSIKGVGFFPPRREPRVLWAGLSECEELFQLQTRIERMLRETGVAPDARKFHAHVTVARMDGAHSERVAGYLSRNSLLVTEPFAVSAFHLYSSVLHKDGAVHEKEACYELR